MLYNDTIAVFMIITATAGYLAQGTKVDQIGVERGNATNKMASG